jgi:hypothetical protein
MTPAGFDPDGPPLTVPEFARLLNLREETVRIACAGGRLAGAVKVLGQWRIPRSAVPASLRPAPAPTESRGARTRRAAAALAAAGFAPKEPR